MKKIAIFIGAMVIVVSIASFVLSAYHHQGEIDSPHFLAQYPEKAGSKLDHCALCHTGGSYEQDGRWVSLGSCQWCHYKYGYDGSGNIIETLNHYGMDYLLHGRNRNALIAIEGLDSDGDGYINAVEIAANRYPGNPNDDPGKVPAPFRVYSKSELEAMGQHTQFLLMNTSRSGDFYAEYMGVPMWDLLKNAGILDSATGITVFAPDGWSDYHPINPDPDPELYHVKGIYPESVYYYHEQADIALSPIDGWCNYSSPSGLGRNHMDPILNPNGNKMILAYKREGQYMDPGVLGDDNKLNGEGPFRIIPPQKVPSPPDQSSRSANQNVVWPYDFNWDHNAGSSTRTATIIRVDPLPEGTTDIDIMEAGWQYVDEEKIIVYGALKDTDPPVPNIMANGFDGVVSIPSGQEAVITVTFDPGSRVGQLADWWVLSYSPGNTVERWNSYVLTPGWISGIQVCIQAGLFPFNTPFEVFRGVLPPGEHIFYFGADANSDGFPNFTWLDSVRVSVVGQ